MRIRGREISVESIEEKGICATSELRGPKEEARYVNRTKKLSTRRRAADE